MAYPARFSRRQLLDYLARSGVIDEGYDVDSPFFRLRDGTTLPGVELEMAARAVALAEFHRDRPTFHVTKSETPLRYVVSPGI